MKSGRSESIEDSCPLFLTSALPIFAGTISFVISNVQRD